MSIFTKNGLFGLFSVEIDNKCILCELKLPDENDLYLVRSVLMRSCVLLKKNREESPPLWGSKIPQKLPSKGCVIIAQCAGVGESHFVFFFIRLRFQYINAIIDGGLGQKSLQEDFLLSYNF